MPGPNRAPRGGYQKPKDLKKTVSRLLGYLTRSKLPLLAVLAFLLLSVATNIGGSYMMRGIINDFVWSGCTDFAGLGKAVLVLIAVELLSAFKPSVPRAKPPASIQPSRFLNFMFCVLSCAGRRRTSSDVRPQ